MVNYDLIVVGAGITGKATALRMAQLGLQVLHIAPSFDPGFNCNESGRWDSRIYALSASSQALLAKLQVWDAMDHSRIQVVSDMRIFGDSTRFDDELHFSAYSATVPQLAWIVESSHIEKTLDLATQFQKGITRITDTVKDFIQHTDSIEVHTEKSTYQAKLMLAADGARSPTRERLNIETLMNDYEQTAVVANFAIEQPHRGTAYQWFLPGGEILALLPLAGSYVSMVWSAQTEHAKEMLKMDAKTLAQHVLMAGEQSVRKHYPTLTLVTDPQPFPLRRIRAKRILGTASQKNAIQDESNVTPRIILLGDAAHVMHPLAGQGLNLGLRDVASLGELFEARESFRSIDDRTLLRRYERSRQGDTDALLLVTDRLQKLFSHDSEVLKGIRNMGLRLLNRSDFAKRQLIQKALA